METNNSTEIREHIRNESPTYKKFMKIYLMGYKNKSCPNTLWIIIIVIIIVIIVIILILFL